MISYAKIKLFKKIVNVIKLLYMNNTGMNQIRTSITTVHEISQNIYDNTTILQSLQEKVAEILNLKQIIADLEMQLKIEKEASKLQSAEFAFREQEYEAEINSLKENLEIFQKGLIKNVDKSSSRYYEVDVLLKTEKEKTERLIKKLSKWKSKATLLLEENQRLKIEIEKLKKDDSKDKQFDDQVNQLKIQIKQIKEKAKQALDDKNTELNNLRIAIKDEKSKLLAHIQKLEQEIKANNDKFSSKLNNQKNQYMDKLKDKENQFKEEQGNFLNEIEELKGENDRLRSNIDKLSKHIKELEQKLSSSHKKLKKFELELELLGKNLDVSPGKITDHEWDPINAKINELLEKAELLEKSSQENEFLRKRLNTATDEIQRQKKIENEKPPSEDDQLIKSLQTSLHQTRDDLEKTQSALSFYKLRNSFSKLIDHQQSRALNSFLDLHSSIFQSDQSNLRSIILTIIFALRFPKLAKNKNNSFDPRTLLFYHGRPELSFDKKVSDIRQKIFDLEHDILFLKQNIEDIKSETNKVILESEENSRKANSRTNYESEKQINKLKQQISQMTKELSHHVSPDLYNGVCLNLEKLEGVNKSLKKENSRLTNLLEKRNKRYDELKNKFRTYILASDHQTKIYNQTKEDFDNKNNEIETLKSLLNEKNKEILALERLVNRHETNARSITNSCACIVAENESLNNHLQGNCEPFCESPKCKELRGKCIMCSINQEFLGNYNTNYCCF